MAILALIGSWLWGKVQPIIGWIALGAAVVVTILLVMARVKQAGQLQERVETMQRTIDQVKVRKEVESENAAERRNTGITANEQLHRDWQRD